MTRITPMMQQYLEQKKNWPDCLLFFRLGDFYELFFEDAMLASRELELALTGRDCGQVERAPMCGVPYHAAENYLNRLVSRGHKVAICEQVEDPALAKGIVRREVIRVVTPGTILEPSALDEKRNNYIVAIYQLNQYYGLAACDLSTGIFETTQMIVGQTAAKLNDELSRYNPSEIVHNSYFAEQLIHFPAISRNNIALSCRPDNEFTAEFAKNMLPQADDHALWARASAALVHYLSETQHQKPAHLSTIAPYQITDYMTLDQNARRNLELTETLRDKQRKGSLLWAIDRTQTSMGSRLLRRWLEQPLLSYHDINARQESVAAFKDAYLIRQEIRERLHGLHDLERLSSKLALKSVNARDLIALKRSLFKLPGLLKNIQSINSTIFAQLIRDFDPLPDLAEKLEAALTDEPPLSIREGEIIKPGYHSQVDLLRVAAQDGKQWIVDLEMRERERTGIRSLKVGYNKVFGFYLDVTKSNMSQVPDDYIRKQTLANGERYVTTELKEMEDVILGAEQKSVALEYDIFCQIRDQVASELAKIQRTATALATIDCLTGLAELADRERYCRPLIDLGDRLEINQGRHPVVEKMLQSSQFVPNDTSLNLSDHRLMILTGPNMAGKSTYMRQVAQIVLLAQIGSFVPATSAQIGIVDRVFTRVGASDDLGGGQSTFMVEMSEVAAILHHATQRSLLILDEIGRGTSTYDGLSIAWSVIEHVSDLEALGCRTLFATHYHELTDLEATLPGVFNAHVAVDENEGEVVFLHQIRAGGSDDSYGIEVAKIAGVPDSVVRRARELLFQLESENDVRNKKKVARLGRPMDGQIDLFASAMAGRGADVLLEKLKSLEIHQLTPLDALNILHDLHQKAKGSGGNHS
ncbi:MAG: DNA mismatch repair protein MutS [Eubacteriales bacterium]|nr:DNA mismatch repair protein MutS [Eubacteriales bacterium]